jgi:hypothetical protein
LGILPADKKTHQIFQREGECLPGMTVLYRRIIPDKAVLPPVIPQILPVPGAIPAGSEGP